VREDLSSNQQAVQAIHAAVEATRQGLIPTDIEHPSLVLCGVPNEAALASLRRKLDLLGLRYVSFTEPDIGNQHTAVAIEPLTKNQRRDLKHLRLLNIKEPTYV